MARLRVEVHPRASRPRVEWDGVVLTVWVREAPENGAANAAVLHAVAKWLRTAPSRLRLGSGRTARVKMIDIGDLTLPAAATRAMSRPGSEQSPSITRRPEMEILPSGVPPIDGVSTSTTAFIGKVGAGPTGSATEVGSLADFVRTFGPEDPEPELAYAVRAYYTNGGGEAHIVRVADDNSLADGLPALDAVEQFGLLCLPGETDVDVLGAALAYAERRHAFLLVDPPGEDLLAAVALARALAVSGAANAAVFYPNLREAEEPGAVRMRAPSGAVAGIYARTDRWRGVWAPPAGAQALLLGLDGPAAELQEPDLAALQAAGVNSIRTFPGGATVLWDARTVQGADTSASEWMYVSVRRVYLYLERSLDLGLQWTVFEPNDESLWASVRRAVDAFLNNLWRAGALVGRTPAEAYFVSCDRSTMSQEDLDNGRLRVVAGFAPLKPAEFVIVEVTKPPAH